MFFSKWHDGHKGDVKDEREKHQNALVEEI
jgi:hypothetical protein